MNKENIRSAFNSKGLEWDSIESEDEQIVILGQKSFSEAREIQNKLVQQRIKNEIKDTLIFTEHKPTLSLGNRVNDSGLEHWRELGVEVVKTNRGGQITFHSPGQLIIYPVIKIKSVKTFISDFLNLISQILKDFDINAVCKIQPAGLWVGKQKICSVGLKIDQKVTNHGFSLNLSCNLEPFSEFNVCGSADTLVTSVLELKKDANILNLLTKSLINNSLKFIA